MDPTFVVEDESDECGWNIFIFSILLLPVLWAFFVFFLSEC